MATQEFRTGDGVMIEGKRYTVTLLSDYQRRYGGEPPEHEKVMLTPDAVVIDGRAKPNLPRLDPRERFITTDGEGMRRRWAVVPSTQPLPGDHLWEAAYLNTNGE